jgi:hypothetical protein
VYQNVRDENAHTLLGGRTLKAYHLDEQVVDGSIRNYFREIFCEGAKYIKPA